MRWLFGKKEPGAKLLSLLSLWHTFETVDLNQPGLEDKLHDFTTQLEQQMDEAKSIVTSRAQAGTPDDINFIFDILLRIPAPPAQLKTLPSDPDFQWEKAETGLGTVARVVRDIRVAVQKRIVAPYEKELSRRKSSEREILQNELHCRLQEVDQEYRTYLTKLLKLYELYDHCLEALAQVESPAAQQEIVNRLCAPSPQERLIALKTLSRRHWEPKNLEQALNFHLARIKLSDDETERKAATKTLEKLIRTMSDARVLREDIEPRLAEEGLTNLQALALIRLAEIAPQAAQERFAELFRSGDEPDELKVAALKAIGESILPQSPDSAIELLLTALDDLDVETRVRAAATLGHLPEKTAPEYRIRAQERLIFALRDGDLEVREAAATALNPKTYPDAGTKLAQFLLTETNPNGREYAARALGLNFPPQAETTPALVRALTDEDAAVRKAAADALAAQGAVPTEPETRLQFLCARQEWQSLINAGKPALNCLIPRLRDQREEIRLAVVKTLGKIGAPEAVKELCIALSDSSREVRKAAANALAAIGDPQAAPALKSAISREGFAEVRAEMERALRRLC
ncbi:hypothetical protein HPY86_02725 [candidate division WOR-3 bacterium]|nr:hypothetical protein [candidate division WOR-3 bacterium]